VSVEKGKGLGWVGWLVMDGVRGHCMVVMEVISILSSL
jgi:hypothetical protein